MLSSHLESAGACAAGRLLPGVKKAGWECSACLQPVRSISACGILLCVYVGVIFCLSPLTLALAGQGL